jgi:hypothetical protein
MDDEIDDDDEEEDCCDDDDDDSEASSVSVSALRRARLPRRPRPAVDLRADDDARAAPAPPGPPPPAAPGIRSVRGRKFSEAMSRTAPSSHPTATIPDPRGPSLMQFTPPPHEA